MLKTSKEEKILKTIVVGVILGFMLFQGLSDYKKEQLQEAHDGQLIQGMYE